MLIVVKRHDPIDIGTCQAGFLPVCSTGCGRKFPILFVIPRRLSPRNLSVFCARQKKKRFLGERRLGMTELFILFRELISVRRKKSA